MAADEHGSPAGIVFRRLDGAPERHRAARMLAGSGAGLDDSCVWYALVDLTTAETRGLAGVAVVRPAGTATVRLCALAVAGAYRGRGLGRRLIGEVADRLRAAGAERLAARSPPGGDLAVLLTRAGFAGRDDGQEWSLAL
jgi:GNAT superfamily N-acetyltransferase